MAAPLASCEDFLAVGSPDQLTSDSFWRNQADAEAGLSAAYSQLEYSIDTWGFAEVKWPVEAYREDIVVLGYDAMNYPNWVELSNFSYTNGNSQVSEYWSNNYRGVSFANQVIEKVAAIADANIDPAVRTQIVNEALFLRAYYHLKLILNFKDIIVRDKYITNQAELSKALASRDAAWDFIIDDLKTATALPASHNADNVGRATSGAAYAYLGFAYLTRAWEESDKKAEYMGEALKAFDAVKGYELEKNFVGMFDGTNKNGRESIFELQFTMSTANGADYRTALHRWIGSQELGGWDEITPSAFLFNQFTEEGQTATTGRYDSRLYATLFFRSDYFNDPQARRVYGGTYDDRFNDDGVPYNRPVFRKMMPPTLEALRLSRFANNIPLMRYANVLLMKAEALNELGRTAEAIPLIDQVRSVHGDMPAMTGTSKEAVAAQIEHERIIEFPLENFRWYDLRRWGKLPEAMQAAGRTGFNMEKNAWYPVPLTEINSNESLK
jgi:hypothetical protein